MTRLSTWGSRPRRELRAPGSRPAPESRPPHRRPGRAVVVGAGLGGLSAACHLAGAGHEVTVLERSDVPGGRAGQWSEAGYRFDTGPAVLTMRDILERTFAAAGADLEDHLTLERLDPAYRARFWDGSEIRVRADRAAMADEVRAAAGPEEAAGFERFVAWVTELYRIEFASFIDRDFRTPLDLLATPGAMARLVGAGGFRRLQHKVDGFFADERLRRLFSFQAMYAGLSPSTPWPCSPSSPTWTAWPVSGSRWVACTPWPQDWPRPPPRPEPTSGTAKRSSPSCRPRAGSRAGW